MAEERMQLEDEIKEHGLKATALQTRTAVLTGKIQEFERIGNRLCKCSWIRSPAYKRWREENDQEEDGEDEADEPPAKRLKRPFAR
jgi:hypothetical protein